MRDALKQLRGESLVYGLGQFGGRAVQLLLVPVLTRVLAPAEYAVSELVVAYSQTAIFLLVLGMDAALARFFYGATDRAARIGMTSTSLWFRLALGLAVALVLLMLARPIAVSLLGNAVYTKYVAIGAATVPFTLLTLFANDVLRVTFQPDKFIAMNLLQTLVAVALALYLVVVRDIGVVGVLYGRLAADGCAALLGLLLLRHSIRFRFEGATLRRMLAFGLPLVPAAFAFGLMASLDRFFLLRSHTLADVGAYSVAMKFFAVATLAVSGFQLAYGPIAYARAAATGAAAGRMFARVFAGFAALMAVGGLAISAAAPLVLEWLVPPVYRDITVAVAWLAFAAAAYGAYTLAAIGVSLSLRTWWLAGTAGLAVVVDAVAQALLTPRFGVAGAAAATCCAYATAAVLTYRAAQHLYPLPYQGARAAMVLGAGLVLALFVSVPGWIPAGPLGWLARAGVVVLFAGVLAVTRAWSLTEAQLARATAAAREPDRESRED
ncbi:MAG: oligosaccharide flippase family protein [Candidatus Eisenbacteria bacterium]|uniref:Oligosaccharide flippase family protein n=1 Tax=Eiseniibacteriota bacterium TaxID=2212470 RepID=A0A849SRC8_UNCEI|nr:oligosaccharide flippase family protein [Candidatus Eisenbacteria bacterium]